MNNNKSVTSTNQPSRPQSNILRSFTLINLYQDSLVLLADSEEGLTSALASQSMFDSVLGLESVASRLWAGCVVVLNVCEVVIVPSVHSVVKLDLDYYYPNSSNTLVYLVDPS